MWPIGTAVYQERRAAQRLLTTHCPASLILSTAARFPSSGQQVETQLPGALLTISSTGPASQANGSTPIITIGGYASSANLLRSNILVCKAVLHVVDSVLLVSGCCHVAALSLQPAVHVTGVFAAANAERKPLPAQPVRAACAPLQVFGGLGAANNFSSR